MEPIIGNSFYNYPKAIYVLAIIFFGAAVVVWIYLSIPLPPSPGTLSDFKFITDSSGGEEQGFQSLVYFPSSYDVDDDSKKWPLVLFLHGSWQRGHNLDLVRSTGLPKLIEDGGEYPFIMVAPQCPEEDAWRTDDLLNLIDQIEEQFHVDEDCIHVTGFELGGFASWDLAMSTPQRFATVVPFSGGPIREKQDSIEWISQVHLWYLYSLADRTSRPWRGDDATTKAWLEGKYVRITKIYDRNAPLWKAWTNIYENADILSWMLSKKRKSHYKLRWANPPQAGKQVWGELCEKQAGKEANPLLGFWLYLPPAPVDATQENKVHPLIMSLHGDNRSQQAIEPPLPHAIQEGFSSSCLIVSPQCPSGKEWESSLLTTLLDQLDVEIAFLPHRLFLTGVDKGAKAAWNLATEDPWRFAAMALFDYQSGPLHQQQAHRLWRIPKWFFSKDRTIQEEVDYYSMVARVWDKKAHWLRPEWTILENEEWESWVSQPFRTDKIVDWLVETPVTDLNVRRERWLTNYPELGLHASPEVVALFEKKEYLFDRGRYKQQPIQYRLHSPPTKVPGKTYPLIIWLHGHGQDEFQFEAGELKYMDYVFRKPHDPKSREFYLLAMPCQENRRWFDKHESRMKGNKTDEPITILMEIVQDIRQQHPIDTSQISLVGISSGGAASWELMKRHPNYFAAIVPFSSSGSSFSGIKDLSGESIWAFKGLRDRGIDQERRTVREARRLGANVRFTEVPTDCHQCWAEAFAEHNLLKWLLQETTSGEFD